MPEIPTFTAQPDATVVARPLADIAPFQAPGNALAQAGSEIGNFGAEWENRYADAKRQADAENIAAASTSALQDARFRYSRMTDRTAALAGFTDEANRIRAQALAQTSDPLMQSYISRAIGPTVLSLGQAVSEDAFNRESSLRRGQLDVNLLNYATAAASAPNPEAMAHFHDLAQQAIAGAAAASWIAPEEAAQKGLKFNSDVAKAGVERLMLQDPARAAQVLADPTARAATFPGLLPVEAEQLALRADNRAYRMEMRATAAQAHADAIAERTLRHAQTVNELGLMADVLNGKPVDIAHVADMAQHDMIGPGAVTTVMAMQDRRDAGRDDPQTLLHAYDQLNAGALTSDAIHEAVSAHQMRAETGVRLIQGIAARQQREETPLIRANFGVLRTGFKADAIEAGVFGHPDTAPEAALWTRVQQEWVDRVYVHQEDSTAVQKDLIARLSPTVQQPLLGTVKTGEDLARVAALTVRAHDTGQMDDLTYAQQVARLNALRTTLGAPTATGKPPPAPPTMLQRLLGGQGVPTNASPAIDTGGP